LAVWVRWDLRHVRCNQSIDSRGRIRLRDGWAKRAVWFRLSERMKERGEQLYVGGAVASGLAAALEYDRAAGCGWFS
jgi:hypothetical protein